MGFGMEDDYMSMDGQLGLDLSIQDEAWHSRGHLSVQMLNNLTLWQFNIDIGNSP